MYSLSPSPINENNRAATSNEPHPWITGTQIRGTQHTSDRFSIRSSRRKDHAWSSDASTISTSLSSQSSQISSYSRSTTLSSSKQFLGKIEEPMVSNRRFHSGTPPPLQNTIQSPLSKDPRYFMAETASQDGTSLPSPKRKNKGVLQCDDDLSPPPAPRNPRSIPRVPTTARPTIIDATPIQQRRSVTTSYQVREPSFAPRSHCLSPLTDHSNVRNLQVPALMYCSSYEASLESTEARERGPIDCDTSQAYLEDASTDSFAIMTVEDGYEKSACGSVSSAYRIDPYESVSYSGSMAARETRPIDCCIEDEEDPGLQSFLKWRNLDLSRDTEDDLVIIRRYFQSFPILDERESDRILCGYSRGFEPIEETASPRHSPRSHGPFEI